MPLAITGLIFLPLARNAWLANASDGTPGTAFMNCSALIWCANSQVGDDLADRLGRAMAAVALVLFAVLLVTGMLAALARVGVAEPHAGVRTTQR